MIHLYSTDVGKSTDPDDLEFTLAVADTVAVALENLSKQQELAENLNQIRDENLQLRERLGVQSEIVGGSEPMNQVTRDIARAAPVALRSLFVAKAVSAKSSSPALCTSPARAAKARSSASIAPPFPKRFWKANSSVTKKARSLALPERKIGKFEASNKGTLMLDEIGEMSPKTQAKFLRVLEGHPFERVGGSEQIKVDVRVIAATNRDLEKDVSEGTFRRDLYFRLHVLEIIVPALRKRKEDIPELAEYFLHRFITETGAKIKGFSPRAMEEMLRYRWPGNVREMKNVIERAVVLTRSEYIDHDDLVLSTLRTAGDTDSGIMVSANGRSEPASLADMEKQHIVEVLRQTGWNKSRAAIILGIERSTLDRKIRRYDLVEERHGD